MRKLILTILTGTLFITSIGYSQDFEGLNGKKAYKKAARLLDAFNVDQTRNASNLDEALELIKHAVKQEDAKEDPEAWVTMGNIYNGISTRDMTQKLLDPKYESKNLDAGNMGFNAFSKSLELEPGNNAALEGIRLCISGLSNSGLTYYESGDYTNAFNVFQKVLDIHAILKDNNEGSPLDSPGEYDNQMYVTGLAALNAGDTESAKLYFQQLYEKGYDKATVYDAMYKIVLEEGDDKALVILNKGREMYPDDLGLLYSEINHYLRAGNIEVLEDKLMMAIEKDPENPSLYSTLGNVYDNLYQNAASEGKQEQASAYFNSAKEYYERAIEMKPEYTDAIYSIGALYYNKAALITQQMNELANDYSAAGTEKFNAKKKEVEAIFDTALPYFKSVEKLDPNDRNTLIALKEIYARKNEFEMSNEFKDRLDRVESGGTNEASYFQNN